MSNLSASVVIPSESIVLPSRQSDGKTILLFLDRGKCYLAAIFPGLDGALRFVRRVGRSMTISSTYARHQARNGVECWRFAAGHMRS
jgi:ribosomal protein L36